MSARIALLALTAALGLSACASFPPSVGASRQTPGSGGSAGQMGPGYCHRVPEDASRINQWNQLCFTNN